MSDDARRRRERAALAEPLDLEAARAAGRSACRAEGHPPRLRRLPQGSGWMGRWELAPEGYRPEAWTWRCDLDENRPRLSAFIADINAVLPFDLPGWLAVPAPSLAPNGQTLWGAGLYGPCPRCGAGVGLEFDGLLFEEGPVGQHRVEPGPMDGLAWRMACAQALDQGFAPFECYADEGAARALLRRIVDADEGAARALLRRIVDARAGGLPSVQGIERVRFMIERVEVAYPCGARFAWAVPKGDHFVVRPCPACDLPAPEARRMPPLFVPPHLREAHERFLPSPCPRRRRPGAWRAL